MMHLAQKSHLNHESECADNTSIIYRGSMTRRLKGE